MPRLTSHSPDGRHTWHSTPLAALPNAPACYAIFQGDQLMYIGSAIDVRDRIREHGLLPTKHRHPPPLVPLDRVSIKIAFNKRRFAHATRELRLIFRLAPPLNAKRVGRSARQQNRNRRIAAAIDRDRDRSPVPSVQHDNAAVATTTPTSSDHASQRPPQQDNATDAT
jgi:hypothetical protein